MSTVRVELVVIGVTLGVLALVAATTLATRDAHAVRGGRIRGSAPLVPWLGTLAVVLLLVRGAIAGAVVVALATFVHAAVTRWRAVVGRRRP